MSLAAELQLLAQPGKQEWCHAVYSRGCAVPPDRAAWGGAGPGVQRLNLRLLSTHSNGVLHRVPVQANVSRTLGTMQPMGVGLKFSCGASSTRGRARYGL